MSIKGANETKNTTTNDNNTSSSPSSSSMATTTSYVQSLPREARNLLAGGLAGMLAKSAVAPVDRIKILYQVTSARFRLRDVPNVALAIIEKEGIGALWRGNTATMIRVFPYSGIQFMVFDYCKTYFLGRHRTEDDGRGKKKRGGRGEGKGAGLSPVESLQAGMVAGTVSVLLTYPLDMARAQLAVLRREKRPMTTSPSLSPSSSMMTASSTGARRRGGGGGIGYVLTASYKRGGFLGLYRGITPTMLGILPYSGLAFTINEQAKRKVHAVTGREPSTFERLICGGLSGLFAQTLSYPLEVTRRRMQTIGIVPTTGSESAAVMVAQLMPPSSSMAMATSAATADGMTGTEGGQGQQQHQSSEQTRGQHRPQKWHASMSHQQPQPHNPRYLEYSSKPPSMITTMKRLFEEQGARGFFKGVTMNWVKGPIAFGISFTAFDTIQGLIESEDERTRRKGGHSAKVNISRRLTNNED